MAEQNRGLAKFALSIAPEFGPRMMNASMSSGAIPGAGKTRSPSDAAIACARNGPTPPQRNLDGTAPPRPGRRRGQSRLPQQPTFECFSDDEVFLSRYGPFMAREKRSRKTEPSRGSPASAEKTIISIRMPIEILNFVEGESRSRAATLGLKGDELEGAINITAQINRMLESLRSWFGLPAIVADVVEKDRAALGLGRLEYLQHLVFRRYEALIKHGPGFDKDVPPSEKSPGRRA
jgi:hypothetical protein